MRKPHPGYDSFIKEQKPKYGTTFLEWYKENYKIGEIDLLSEFNKRNQCFTQTDWPGLLEETYFYYYKDFLTKKLQLCHSLISHMHNEPLEYELGVVADVMDLYEDVIQEICIRDNVYVCKMPSGIYNKRNFHSEKFRFNTFDELKEEMATGLTFIYHFKIFDDFSIEVRYFKWEPLTRTVLFERNNQ